jgi:G6PDH family F420-dependent oxidoreductase
VVGFGYTLLCEQSGPRELVRYAAGAERAGFDFAAISDHAFPWLESQGHSPYAWAVLGAVTQGTERLALMTYVTCPTMRYHPAVVAQKAATVQILSGGRFTLGLGSGENLNEHIARTSWPPANVRQEMLGEAIEIIAALFDGGYAEHVGRHYRVDSAKLWDVPETRVPLAVAVSGARSVRQFAPMSDAMIAVQPAAELCQSWDATVGGQHRKIGQLPVCWDSDPDAALKRAHDQFRWFGGGWKVNAELPGPSAFAAASQFVTPEDVARDIPCGPDVDQIVAAAGEYWRAGFTDVALCQIGGGQQDAFLDFAGDTLLPALRQSSSAATGG